MAVLTRVECRDVLNIYSVAADPTSQSGGWDLLKQFHIDTDDCVQIDWSPDDAQIVCVDSPLTYNICVYTPSGQKLLQHKAYDHALGIKSGPGVKFSPSASFLAVGSYDQSLRIFNNATGCLMTTCQHDAKAVNIQGKKGASLVLYAEKPLNPQHAISKLAGPSFSSGDDKENMLHIPNPLDDASSNFEMANVATMEGVPPPDAGDVVISKQSGAVKKLGAAAAAAAAKKGPAAGLKGKPAAAGRPGSAAASAASKKSSSTSFTSTSSSLVKKPASSLASSAEVAAAGEKAILSIPSKYVVDALPLVLPTPIAPSVEKADPKIGISIVAWSTGDRYLVSRNDSVPTAVWVWDTQKLALAAVLQQLEAVRCIAWDPKRLRFALCTATSKLFLWSPEGCSVVDVPLSGGQTFQVRKMEWNVEGTCVLLMDKTKFCCCYLRD